jgi:hypothetical protein
VLDEATLEVNVLSFLGKSFSYDRSAEIEGRPFSVFYRTETESESRFRPQLVHIKVVVPREWVVARESEQELLLARDGQLPAIRTVTEATESGTVKSRFEEQGIAFRREILSPGTHVYVPDEVASAVLSSAGKSSLGLGAGAA